MPTIIEDIPEQHKGWTKDGKPPCLDREHNPPTHIHVPIGKQIRHTCPRCGKEQIIKSNLAYY